MSTKFGEERESTGRDEPDLAGAAITRRQVLCGIGGVLLVVGTGCASRLETTVAKGSNWPAGTYHSNVTLIGSATITSGDTVILDPNRDVVVTLTMNNGPGGTGSAGLIIYGTLVSQPNPGRTHEFRFNGAFTEANFAGADLAVANGDDIVDSDIGIWVRDGGRVVWQGVPRTRLAHLAEGANSGDTALAMTVPSNWRVGDVVVVAGTAPTTTKGFANTSEMFAIGTGTTRSSLALASEAGGPESLRFAHPSVVIAGTDYYPEVLNLSSNLKINGQSGQRVHVHICQPNIGARHTINNVEFALMGPEDPFGNGFVGRYPLHFHDCGDNVSGLVVESCVINSSGFHAFVPHMSNGITLSNCVTHNTKNVAYWWDNGDKTDRCTWTGCVASSCYNTSAAFQLGITDDSTITNCVSICQQGGATSSGYLWPSTSNVTTGFWNMTNCLAHNSTDLGMYPYLNNFVRDSPVNDGFVAYNCGGGGSEHGAYGNFLRFKNVKIAHCGGAPLDPPVDGALVLEVTSPSIADLVYYENCVFDASGLAVSALVVKWTGGISVSPIQFLGCQFNNSLLSAVNCINAGDESVRLTKTDFIGCTVDGTGLSPSDIKLSDVLPGTVFRIQDQASSTSATQLDWDGTTTTIAAFYP
jgi:hypothetical protein